MFGILVVLYAFAVASLVNGIQSTSQDSASVLASVLVAIATLTLAIVGFLTYIENKNLVSEMIKDRLSEHIRRQIMELYSPVLACEHGVMSPHSIVAYSQAYSDLVNLMNERYYLAGPDLRKAAEAIVGRLSVKTSKEVDLMSVNPEEENQGAKLRKLFDVAYAEMKALSEEYAKIVSVETSDQ